MTSYNIRHYIVPLYRDRSIIEYMMYALEMMNHRYECTRFITLPTAVPDEMSCLSSDWSDLCLVVSMGELSEVTKH